MSIATIQQTIDRGNVSIYLAGNNNAKGSLFGARIASPTSPITIAMVTDALDWGYDGGAQTDESLRAMANYLTWLIGVYGQQAEAILQGSGGGTVVPGGGGTASSVYPIYIISADFEANGTSYNNSNIVGDNLIIFINEYSQQWLVASGTTFAYTATGINILIPGFDANTQSWSMVIEKFNN